MNAQVVIVHVSFRRPPQDEYKRIRAQQRQQIMEEVENRELTFTPQINPNSYAVRTAAGCLYVPSCASTVVNAFSSLRDASRPRSRQRTNARRPS